jgi:hypothetical protein
MTDFYDDDLHVEALAAMHAASLPLHNPIKCREIVKVLPAILELLLERREARLARGDPSE